MDKNGNNKKNKKRLKNIVKILIALNLLFAPVLIYSNTHIDTEYITFKSSELPESFDGVRIVHLSDYHNHGGSYDDKLIKKIKDADPDYIFLTGDIADRIFTDIDKADNFLKRVSEISPCYLSWGNHDKALKDKDFIKMRDFAENCGITILDSDTVTITKGNGSVTVSGSFDKAYTLPAEEGFDIILHHFPEDMAEIAENTAKAGNQVELMFSGHAHGGLIRFPFIKGLYAPGQGFLPEYTSGLYEYNGTSMIVSRGLGNSASTLRLFDPFHLVVCTLEKE